MARLIFCDLDGVLADFAAGVAALFGLNAPELRHRGRSTHEVLGLREDQMWARITEAGRPFWENLPTTDCADALVGLLRAHGELIIASSPSGDPVSASGKMRWLQKRFTRRFRDFVLTSRKDLLAAPGRLLIDDSLRHVEAFRQAGGEAVLFPSWENGLREEGRDPLAVVQAALEV